MVSLINRDVIVTLRVRFTRCLASWTNIQNTTKCVKDCGLHSQKYRYQNLVCMFNWISPSFNRRNKKDKPQMFKYGLSCVKTDVRVWAHLHTQLWGPQSLAHCVSVFPWIKKLINFIAKNFFEEIQTSGRTYLQLVPPCLLLAVWTMKNWKWRTPERSKIMIFRSGADAIKKFTPSLGIPYLGV